MVSWSFHDGFLMVSGCFLMVLWWFMNFIPPNYAISFSSHEDHSSIAPSPPHPWPKRLRLIKVLHIQCWLSKLRRFPLQNMGALSKIRWTSLKTVWVILKMMVYPMFTPLFDGSTVQSQPCPQACTAAEKVTASGVTWWSTWWGGCMAPIVIGIQQKWQWEWGLNWLRQQKWWFKQAKSRYYLQIWWCGFSQSLTYHLYKRRVSPQTLELAFHLQTLGLYNPFLPSKTGDTKQTNMGIEPEIHGKKHPSVESLSRATLENWQANWGWRMEQNRDFMDHHTHKMNRIWDINQQTLG